MNQNDLKTTSLVTSVTKNPYHQTKKFFECSLLDGPILFNAIGGGARALVRQLKTAVFKAEIEVRIYRRPALKVLIHHL